MTLRHIATASDIINILFGATQEARLRMSAGASALPAPYMVDHSIDQKLTLSSAVAPLVRTTYQAKIHHSVRSPSLPSFCMIIAPLTDVFSQLVDWSSPMSTAIAAEAASQCCKVYIQALHGSGLYLPDDCAEARHAIESAIASTMDSALRLLAPAHVQVEPTERVTFDSFCTLVGDNASTADKAALRDAITHLDSSAAMTLMAQSRIVFGAPPVPAAEAKDPYELFRDGSTLRHEPHLATALASPMAKACCSPSMRLDSPFATPRLDTPDGMIRGATEIASWGRDVLAMKDAFEIASSTGPGLPRAKRLCL